MRRRWARWRLVLIAALVTPAAAAPLAMAAGAHGMATGPNASACRRTHNVVARTDGWLSIRPPANLGTLQGATPAPDAFGRIYAYSATTVARSDDFGCSWTTVFNAPATTTAGKSLAQSRITSVNIGAGVWVTAATTAHNVGAATIWHSPTGTGNFSYAGAGLPLGGTVMQLAPTNQEGVAYALVSTFSGPHLYVSAPAAASTVTWQSRTVPNFIKLTAIAVDPQVADIVDVASPYAYARSANGGANFPVERRVPSRITAIDASRNSLDVYLASGRMLNVEAGTVSITAPADVTSATHVAITPGVRAVSTSYGDFGYDPSLQAWRPITPLGLIAQHLQMASPTLPPVLYGTAGHLILALPLRFPAGFAVVTPGETRPGSVSLHAVGGFGRHHPSFAPAPRVVTLPVGATQREHYVLRVPARSGPLDVDFLVDTTNSMQPAIAGLRRGMQQIIGTLGRLTPDLQVGLGDFRDYDDGESAKDNGICYRGLHRLLNHGLRHHLYVLDHRIGPVDAALGVALGHLSACAGGDNPEADTIAVTQALTGSGVPGWVPPGQQAGFRPLATKVIVLITDAPMHLRSPYPSMIATSDALRAYDVKLVGISIHDGLSNAIGDLRALVAGSGTHAPHGGLACGSGGSFVPAGAPMVCSVPITGAGIAALAGPVARLIEQVVAPGLLSVQLHTSHTGLASFAGRSSQRANLHATSRLPVTVVYSCPASAAGTATPITLSGAVGATTVAHTSVVLHCLPTPTAAVPPVAVVAAVVAAPPPPPPPVSSNINPNVNPGTGAATQEEQQSQVAVADLGDQPDSAPAVSDNGPDMGAPMLYAAALLLAGSAALALRLRPRPEPVLARAHTTTARPRRGAR